MMPKAWRASPPAARGRAAPQTWRKVRSTGGEPMLASALTCVAHGPLHYRGREATALAETATIEEAAAWFWADRGSLSLRPEPRAIPSGATARARLFAALAAEAGAAPFARGRARTALVEDASSLLGLIADAAAGSTGQGPIHASLAAAWGLPVARADLVRRALVLLLDH
jgi:citrate synthase